VDTSTLKVDSANDNVIVGATSAIGGGRFSVQADLSAKQAICAKNSATSYSTTNNFIRFTNSTDATVGGITHPAVTSLGVWGVSDIQFLLSGAGTTAMTLNASGLGVGGSPANFANYTTIHAIGKTTTAGGVFQTSTSNNSTAARFACSSTGVDLFVETNHPIDFYTSAIKRMTLDTSGNVGIGVTPSAKLDVQTSAGRFKVENFGGSSVKLTSSASFGFVATEHQFLLGATQAMTLDASGNLLVRRTGAGLDNTSGVTIAQSSIGMQTEGNATQIAMNRTTSDGTIVDIRRNNSTVGTIAVTTGGTTYNSISDYRLKEAVQPLVGGLARVSALKPSIYKWKSNGSSGEGFIAHELADVVPAAVTGEKDAVNEDGTVNPQGVDLSKVVPILVAAIQELTARVQTLEAK